MSDTVQTPRGVPAKKAVMTKSDMAAEYRRRAADARREADRPNMSVVVRDGFLKIALAYDRMAGPHAMDGQKLVDLSAARVSAPAKSPDDDPPAAAGATWYF